MPGREGSVCGTPVSQGSNQGLLGITSNQEIPYVCACSRKATVCSAPRSGALPAIGQVRPELSPELVLGFGPCSSIVEFLCVTSGGAGNGVPGRASQERQLQRTGPRSLLPGAHQAGSGGGRR